MLLRQIALLSKTKKVPLQDLTRVSAALQKQVTRDLAPVWNIQATVDGFSSEAEIPPGYWKITVMDKIPGKGAAGFHLDKQGQPFADVEWSSAWSLTASHECLEMLVDPFGHQLATGPSPKPGQGRVSFLVEICDPCEGAAFAYTINTGSALEVPVSDFYTPEYFSPTTGPGVRYSFRGNIRAPRQVLDGGYLSWQNPGDGHIWQLFGPAALGNFKDQGAGTLNRQNSDHAARSTRLKHAAAKSARRPARGRAALMAAGGQCNLVRDPFTGDLSGTNGAQTTVQIKDSTGAASFQSISYAGQQIGSNVASATFTIKSGTNGLSYVYAAPVPSDSLTLTDPCGNVLDRFDNDLSNPMRRREVIA
jgi:hypothetical protein